MMQPVGGMGRDRPDFRPQARTGVITYGAEVTALRRTDARRPRRLEGHADRRCEQATEAPVVICTIPFAGAARHRCRFRAGHPRRDGRGRLRAGGEGCVPGASGGSGRLDQQHLRRHFLDQPATRRRSGIRRPASTQTQGHPGRRLYLVGRSRPRLRGQIARRAAGRHAGRRRGAAPRRARPCRARASASRGRRSRSRGGAWAEWSRGARALEAYRRLLDGDGPFLFAGEHMSYINGWQEGAVRSAHVALARMAERIGRDAH